ncbi:DUF4864 domain-containing protein [Actibacterium atlanticum]|nr:DUF4864 domain-containing protein [Actibacterium atlanticum]
MRYLLLPALIMAGPTVAQEADLSAPQQIITDQIAAFASQDAEAAFVFASPMIQGLFGNPTNFGEMVRNGYPMVWFAQDLQFLEVTPIPGGLRQRVMITDPQGRLHLLAYDLVRLPQGWRINGVQLLTDTERGA